MLIPLDCLIAMLSPYKCTLHTKRGTMITMEMRNQISAMLQAIISQLPPVLLAIKNKSVPMLWMALFDIFNCPLTGLVRAQSTTAQMQMH